MSRAEEILKDGKIAEIIIKYLESKRGGVVSLSDAKAWLEEQLKLHPNADMVKLKRPLLIATPGHDTATQWGTPYFNDLTQYAMAKGFEVVRLHSVNDTRRNWIDALTSKDIVFIAALGHGAPDEFTGWQNQTIIRKGDEEMAKLLAGRVISFLSCSVGRELAPWLVSKGVRAVRAYVDDFIFVIDRSNFPNGYAKWFFDAHLTFDRALIDGLTTGEAFRLSAAKWQEYIARNDVPEICKPFLQHDYEADRLFGDQNAKIVEEKYRVKVYLIDENGNEVEIGYAAEVEPDVYAIEVKCEPGRYRLMWVLEDYKVRKLTDWFTVRPEVDIEPLFPKGGEELRSPFTAKARIVK